MTQYAKGLQYYNLKKLVQSYKQFQHRNIKLEKLGLKTWQGEKLPLKSECEWIWLNELIKGLPR